MLSFLHDLVLSICLYGALFSPQDLLSLVRLRGKQSISNSYLGLAQIGGAGEIWICDAPLWGMNKFGKETIELAHAATGYTKGTCKKLALVLRFTPENEAVVRWRTLKVLFPFPQWLKAGHPTVEIASYQPAGSGSLLSEQFRSDPGLSR